MSVRSQTAMMSKIHTARLLNICNYTALDTFFVMYLPPCPIYHNLELPAVITKKPAF